MTTTPTIRKKSDGPIAKNGTEDMSYHSCVPNFMISSQNAQFHLIIVGLMTFMLGQLYELVLPNTS